jgi:hypothetical protein
VRGVTRFIGQPIAFAISGVRGVREVAQRVEDRFLLRAGVLRCLGVCEKGGTCCTKFVWVWRQERPFCSVLRACGQGRPESELLTLARDVW